MLQSVNFHFFLTDHSSEQAIVTAKANVMIYDDATKKWNSGGSTPGLAKVQIYQHLINQSYRVVGRKLQDQEVVINCMLVKGLKYNQANPTFLQWRDVNAKQVYGLNFQSKEEADAFAQILKLAVDNLNRIAVAAAANIPANVNSTGSSANSSCSSGEFILFRKTTNFLQLGSFPYIYYPQEKLNQSFIVIFFKYFNFKSYFSRVSS
jgi:hypothetical protein